MENNDNRSLMTLEQAIAIAATDVQAKEWIHESASPFKKLMSYYKCAMMEVETKLHIETIRTRLKSPESIIEKMVRNSAELGKMMELLNREIGE